MDNWTFSLAMDADADRDGHVYRLEKLFGRPLDLSEPQPRRFRGHSCPEKQLTGVFRQKTAGRRARGPRSRSRSGSRDEAVFDGNDEKEGDRRDADAGQGPLDSVVERESLGEDGTGGDAQLGDVGPGVGEGGGVIECAGGQWTFRMAGREEWRQASIPRDFEFHEFQRQTWAVEEDKGEDDEDGCGQDGESCSTGAGSDAANVSVMDEVATDVMVGILANFVVARFDLPGAIAGLFAQKAMANLLVNSLEHLAQDGRAGQRRAGSSFRSRLRSASNRRGWSTQFVEKRLAAAEMTNQRRHVQKEPELDKPVQEPGEQNDGRDGPGREDHKQDSHERGNQKSLELENSDTETASLRENRPSTDLTAIANIAKLVATINLGDRYTRHPRPELVPQPVTNTQQTSKGDVGLQQDGQGVYGAQKGPKCVFKHVIINNNSTRHIWHPRVRSGAVSMALRTWERDAALQEADELDFDAHTDIQRQFRERPDYDLTMRLQQAGRISDSPVPLKANLGFFARLHNPAEQTEIILLISTLDFEHSNQHADLIRRSGLEPAAGRWSWIHVSQPVDGAGYSLVTRTSCQAARQVLEVCHWGHFTGHTTGESNSLRVMYVEPREGGELLVEGLTMPEGEHTMMRMLVYYFNAYEM